MRLLLLAALALGSPGPVPAPSAVPLGSPGAVPAPSAVPLRTPPATLALAPLSTPVPVPPSTPPPTPHATSAPASPASPPPVTPTLGGQLAAILAEAERGGDRAALNRADAQLRQLLRATADTSDGAELPALVGIWRAQRRLVPLAARTGEDWIAPAGLYRTRAGQTGDRLCVAVRRLKKAGAAVPARVVRATLGGACEAVVERHPPFPAAILREVPGLAWPGYLHPYAVVGQVLIEGLTGLVRTADEARAFLASVDALAARAHADPAVTREVAARLAGLASTCRARLQAVRPSGRRGLPGKINKR